MRWLVLACVVTVACTRDRGEPPSEGSAGGLPPIRRDRGFKDGTTSGAPPFVLVAESAPIHPGEVAIVHVAVTPRAGYKLNPAFDNKLTVTPPPGLIARRAIHTASDATRNDAHELSFQVELTGAGAGTHRVTGQLEFAVCTADETACLPQTRPLDVAVSVN